jgi:hypothetical protein
VSSIPANGEELVGNQTTKLARRNPLLFKVLLQSFRSGYTVEERTEAEFRQDETMQIRLTLFAIALSIAATDILFASVIFKWTDEDGAVHFSDKPTGESNVERIEIRSRPTDPARVQADVQAGVNERARQAEAEANAPQGPTPEEQRAQALQREERCNKYRERQTEFTNNRRIYRMDENGERIYYDEEEMQAARDQVDDLVKEYCD